MFAVGPDASVNSLALATAGIDKDFRPATTTGRIERLGREYQDLRDLWRRIGLVCDRVALEIPPDEPVIDTVTSGCMAQLGLKFFVGMEPSAADRDRARLELGWRPRYADLEVIVRHAWQWHSTHPRGYVE